MLRSVIPEQYRQKAPVNYKESVVFKILLMSALLTVGTFCVALVYYLAMMKPSPTTNMYDCGGGTCEDMYEQLSGCKWPTFYSGEFRFTTSRRILQEDHHWEEDNHWQEDGHRPEDDHRPEDGHRPEDDHRQEDDHQWQQDGDSHGCEPSDGNYWIIAGQHYGAEESLENVLVRVTGYEFDVWSIVNLSWNAATMTWTVSSVVFSLILGLQGDRYVHPEILQKSNDIELAKRTAEPLE